MKLRRSLYAPPVVVGGQQCAKAPPDGGVSPSTAWSRRWPARGRVVACGPVPAADHPTQRLPGGASGRCSRRRASPWSGRPSCPPHRPLPVLVHRWCPPGPVPRPVRCPTVRCPTVGVSNRRVSGHLAPSSRTDLSGRLVPPVRRSAVWCPPVSPVASVRPGSARRGPWEYAGLAGAFAAGVDRVPDGRAAPSTAAGAWTQATQRRSWVDQVGESVGRGPGRVALEPRRPRSTADRPGRLAWPGAARRRRLPLGRDARLPSVVVVELTPEWTGLEGQ
jgi:hypothetical protein